MDELFYSQDVEYGVDGFFDIPPLEEQQIHHDSDYERMIQETNQETNFTRLQSQRSRSPENIQINQPQELVPVNQGQIEHIVLNATQTTRTYQYVDQLSKSVVAKETKNIPKNLGRHLKNYIKQFPELLKLEQAQTFTRIKSHTLQDFKQLFQSSQGKAIGKLFFEGSDWLESILVSDRAGQSALYIKYIKKFREGCYNYKTLSSLK